MTSYQQGQTAEFRATFYTVAGGSPTDPSSVNVTIYKDAALVAGPFTTLTGDVVRDLPGVYHLEWPVPGDAAVGEDYTAVWTATIAGAERTGYEAFGVTEGGAVVPGLPGGWATPTDVYRATGLTVTDDVVARAQSTIDIASDRTYADAARLGARDIGWLRLATAYQAAWITAQPDMFSRMDITSTGGSGTSSVEGSPEWLTLAPMARRALDRCSWIRSRSVRVRSEFVDRGVAISANAVAEGNDQFESWRSM